MTTITIFEVRLAVRYRRRDGEAGQLEADFGQTIAEDFLDQAAVDAATLFAQPEVADRLNSPDTLIAGHRRWRRACDSRQTFSQSLWAEGRSVVSQRRLFGYYFS